MKFEALILRVLCAGSLLVCVLAFGDALLTGPTRMPATSGALTATTTGAAPLRAWPGPTGS